MSGNGDGAKLRDGAEMLLGRRLRPWWGMSPGRVAARGLIGAAVFGAVIYGCFLVRGGEIDWTGTGLEDQRDTIDTAALVVAGLAAVGLVYRVVQLVVGGLDLVRRHDVEGTVVTAERRRTGDFLPHIVQALWYRGEDQSGRSRADSRRTRYEVVLDTPDGPRSWNVSPRHFSDLAVGRRVRLTVSPRLGHVSRVAKLD